MAKELEVLSKQITPEEFEEITGEVFTVEETEE